VENIWLNQLLILFIFGVLFLITHVLLRKWLKVDRKKIFSYNHINEKHKKIDWTIRIIFITFMLIGFFITVSRSPQDPIWLLQPHIILLVLIFCTELVRAIMEKKHAENPNDYLFTSIQLVIVTIFVASLFMTNFWGLIS